MALRVRAALSTSRGREVLHPQTAGSCPIAGSLAWRRERCNRARERAIGIVLQKERAIVTRCRLRSTARVAHRRADNILPPFNLSKLLQERFIATFLPRLPIASTFPVAMICGFQYLRRVSIAPVLRFTHYPLPLSFPFAFCRGDKVHEIGTVCQSPADAKNTMWCRDCRQDVPALPSADQQTLCCPRCGEAICADTTRRTRRQRRRRIRTSGRHHADGFAASEPPPAMTAGNWASSCGTSNGRCGPPSRATGNRRRSIGASQPGSICPTPKCPRCTSPRPIRRAKQRGSLPPASAAPLRRWSRGSPWRWAQPVSSAAGCCWAGRS